MKKTTVYKSFPDKIVSLAPIAFTTSFRVSRELGRKGNSLLLLQTSKVVTLKGLF